MYSQTWSLSMLKVKVHSSQHDWLEVQWIGVISAAAVPSAVLEFQVVPAQFRWLFPAAAMSYNQQQSCSQGPLSVQILVVGRNKA